MPDGRYPAALYKGYSVVQGFSLFCRVPVREAYRQRDF